MFNKAPTRALAIGMMAAGMLSGCASFGDPQQHRQVERFLRQEEKPVGIVFPIRLDFDEADNMTTLSIQKAITETLESDDQVTVVGFELGQILCRTLDEAEDASVLDFAISPTETLRAARLSYKVFSGETFSDGVTRKVWMGKGTEEDADGTYRIVSLSWTTECNAETFLQTVTTHGPNGFLSVVKSIPCGAGSSIDICIVEIDLDLREPGKPLMPADSSNNNTEDSDHTRRHLGVQKLREGGKESAEKAGDRRNLQSTTPKIDVLILYNKVALEELGNISTSQMETMLAAEVEESNDILVNSEIDLEFALVHTEEWHYELETDEGASILSLLRANDSVSNLRSRYQADLVALIAPLSKACGTGYLYAGVFQLGYSVTDPNCLAGRTLTHEIGHNLGCLHDRDSSEWQHYYAHGLRYCTGNLKIHTIMAYRCGGVDIQYFSNPDVSYSGLPTGTANDADCTRRIRETMVSVSEFSDASMCNDNGGLATSMGNGRCDSVNNNEACLWDRGDCCKSCCTHADCGSNGYDCKDPVGYGDCVITDEPTPTPITEAAPTGSSPPQTTPAPITEAAPTGSSPPQTTPAPITEAVPIGSSPPQNTPAPYNRANRSTSARTEATLLLGGILLYLLSFSQL